MTSPVLDALPVIKNSAAVAVLQPIADHMEMSVEDLIDALAAGVSALLNEPTQEGFRTAIRPLVEPYAEFIEMPWEAVADAVINMMTWPAAKQQTLLDNWKESK
jgi:hypothetical protein